MDWKKVNRLHYYLAMVESMARNIWLLCLSTIAARSDWISKMLCPRMHCFDLFQCCWILKVLFIVHPGSPPFCICHSTSCYKWRNIQWNHFQFPKLTLKMEDCTQTTWALGFICSISLLSAWEINCFNVLTLLKMKKKKTP